MAPPPEAQCRWEGQLSTPRCPMDLINDGTLQDEGECS